MENNETIRRDIVLNSRSEEANSGYDAVYPESEMLAQRLEWFQDMKLGVIFHWGLYTVEGIVESWPLSAEDDWARTRMDWGDDIEAIRQRYWAQNKVFNPINFEPDVWAKKCREAGFKYSIFTTKHHEGFSMFDTQESDYKITGSESPFRNHPKSDIVKEVFNAFRAEHLAIGAYYSKPDWYSPYYWVDNGQQKNQGANYDLAKHPERWQKYVGFVHKQIKEITGNYGEVDLLWLDGGWCGSGREDLQMDQLVEKARANQPELIVVDRASGLRHENYVTPEQEIPDWDKLPKKVWESCISFGHDWGYVADDTYKTTRELIHSLVKIVARGGNLIIGVGPKADGTLGAETVLMMEELGRWMALNGEGIYETRACGVIPQTPDWQLTSKGTDVYAFYIADGVQLTSVSLSDLNLLQGELTQASLLGSGKALPFKTVGSETIIELPAEMFADNGVGIKLEFK